MVYVIDLVTSSSPSVKKFPSSPKFSSSPSFAVKTSNSLNKTTLSQSFTDFDCEEYEKFKREWRKDREHESEADSIEIIDEKVFNSPKISSHFKSPVGLKRRRTSETFQITPTRADKAFNLEAEIPMTPLKNVASDPIQKISRGFKNKAEAINSIRIHMSSSMAEAYESELRRRFTERQMGECVAFDISSVLIPAEMASFRWKFANSSEFIEPRLFVLDTETLWEEFIATKRFNDLLLAYNEPGVFLYFINWKRAVQRHTAALNRQFKLALNTSSETISLVPANELENEFFLAAAKLRLQVNFSTASSAPQSLVGLMDFVIEMTRVVALKGYLKESRSNNDENFDRLNLTLARDVKVKSGKDAKDCWIKVLCQIPRVTPHLAHVIAARYPSFCDLMEAYSVCRAPQEGENLLSELRLEDGSGGNRRIGPVISARIYNHFQ